MRMLMSSASRLKNILRVPLDVLMIQPMIFLVVSQIPPHIISFFRLTESFISSCRDGNNFLMVHMTSLVMQFCCHLVSCVRQMRSSICICK